MFLTDLNSDQLMLLILPALPNMWALKHAMYHDFPTPREKYRWMLACVFLPCVGGLAYYFVGRRHASKEKIDIFARKEEKAPLSVLEDSVPVPLPAEAAAAPSPETKKEGSADCPSGNPAPEQDEWSFGCPDNDRRSSS